MSLRREILVTSGIDPAESSDLLLFLLLKWWWGGVPTSVADAVPTHHL